MTRRLWDDYLDYCNLRTAAMNAKKCDLASSTDMPSATIMPLGAFIRQSGIAWAAPENQLVKAILSGLTRRGARVESMESETADLIHLWGDRAHLPDLEGIARVSRKRQANAGGENAFMYAVGELVDNWIQHSQSKDLWMLVQERQEGGLSELSIIDEGITIGGSLRKTNARLGDDVTAITRAIGGLSSKGTKERGYGLYSTFRIFTEGLHGSVLVASGGGALESSWTGAEGVAQKTYQLGGSIYGLAGTLVSARIPAPAPKLNIHEYTS